MKQMLFMVGTLAMGLIGAVIHPFYAVVPYYLFAILQPQYLWDWALPAGVRWSLAAAGLALLATCMHARRLFHSVRWNMVTGLTLAYSALVLASTLSAYDNQLALFWLDVIGKILAMAILTMLVIQSVQHIQWAAWLVVLSLGYLAWHFNSLYLFEGRMDVLNRGLGAWDNNGVGVLMAMGLPFAYAFARNAPSWRQRALFALMGAFMLHALMLSYCRGAMLAVIVGAAWLLWHHRPRHQSVVLAAGGVLLVLVLAGAEVRQRFFSINKSERDQSIQSRYESWAAAWTMVQDHPLFGVGLRNSYLYSHSYGADQVGRSIHNLYLQTAADSGLPALAVYLTINGIVLVNLGRVRRRLARWQTEHVEARAGSGPDARAETASVETAARLEQIALAFQTSLIVFHCHSMFFSSEMFEVQWLMVAVGGVMPRVVEGHLAKLDAAAMPMPVKPPQLSQPAPPSGDPLGWMRPATAAATATPTPVSPRLANAAARRGLHRRRRHSGPRPDLA